VSIAFCFLLLVKDSVNNLDLWSSFLKELILQVFEFMFMQKLLFLALFLPGQ